VAHGAVGALGWRLWPLGGGGAVVMSCWRRVSAIRRASGAPMRWDHGQPHHPRCHPLRPQIRHGRPLPWGADDQHRALRQPSHPACPWAPGHTRSAL